MNPELQHTPRLDGHHVLVTGGARGIGRCIAQSLLLAGASVTIADTDAPAGEALAAHYPPQTPILFIPTNVADETQSKACVRKAENAFGCLHGLVNNAAIAANMPIGELSLDDWNNVVGVNLTGAFLMSRHAIPSLRITSGTIINIASTRALQSEANTEAYSASKGGLLALTHALAISLTGQIRVHAISPGWIDVRDWQTIGDPPAPALSVADHAQHPAGRVGRPEDIAALVLFLLSQQAGFITGQNFIIDGGMTRKMIYEG